MTRYTIQRHDQVFTVRDRLTEQTVCLCESRWGAARVIRALEWADEQATARTFNIPPTHIPVRFEDRAI